VTSENTPDKNATGKDVRSEADQWIDAVAKLIELTQNGEMQWRVGGRRTPSSGEPTTPAYYANYGKHTYMLEERFVKAPRPTGMDQFLRAFGSGAQKDRYDVNLDLVDENGLSLYRVPNISPVSDLFDIVQKQTAGDEALNELLG
jgi:hypothetical protein